MFGIYLVLKYSVLFMAGILLSQVLLLLVIRNRIQYWKAHVLKEASILEGKHKELMQLIAKEKDYLDHRDSILSEKEQILEENVRAFNDFLKQNNDATIQFLTLKQLSKTSMKN